MALRNMTNIKRSMQKAGYTNVVNLGAMSNWK